MEGCGGRGDINSSMQMTGPTSQAKATGQDFKDEDIKVNEAQEAGRARNKKGQARWSSGRCHLTKLGTSEVPCKRQLSL